MTTKLKNHSNISVWTFCLMVLWLCLPSISQANASWTTELKSITGVVTSAEDSEALIGVTVIVKGTERGTITDIDGTYSIDANEGDVLIFTYTGFADQEVTVGREASYNVVLNTDTALLDEIVVIGYGTQKKSHLTGAISKVDNERLKFRSSQ